MGNPRCSWVRDRLPLVAGNDLLGSERRRVERHLIGCPECRRHREAAQRAYAVLQTAAEESAARSDAPSLWPALARQIQESRRPAGISALLISFGLARPRLRLWPALGLGLSLATAVGLTVAARQQVAAFRAEIAANTRPIAAPVTDPVAPAEAAAPTQLAQQPEPEPEATPAPRYDYVLEHGTPMGPDAPESKSKPPLASG